MFFYLITKTDGEWETHSSLLLGSFSIAFCNRMQWQQMCRQWTLSWVEYCGIWLGFDYQDSSEIRWKYDTNGHCFIFSRSFSLYMKIHVQNVIKTNQRDKTMAKWQLRAEKRFVHLIYSDSVMCAFCFSFSFWFHICSQRTLLLLVFFPYYSKNNMRIETNVELKTSARSENTKWYDFFLQWNCLNLCRISVLRSKWWV